MASLQIFHRHFEAAIELADKAGQIYRELEEAHPRQLASGQGDRVALCR